MKFSESLKKKQGFPVCIQKGKTLWQQVPCNVSLANDLGRNRVGISVSKKVREQHHKTSFNKADP